MLTAKINGEHIVNKIVEALGENYKVKFDPKMNVLNSANYGVPQIRKRVIIIGVRKDINIEPEEMYASVIKTHFDPEMSDKEREGLKQYATVKDAIGELPALRPGEGESKIPFKYSMGNEFLQRIGSKDLSELMDHVARNHNDMDIAKWCAGKKKMVKGGVSEKNITKMKLRPGDLVFQTGAKNGRYKGIYHVEMFVGYRCYGFSGNTPMLMPCWTARYDGYAYGAKLVGRP